MKCVVCGEDIPTLSPSDDFCGSYCRQTQEIDNLLKKMKG